MKARRGAYSQAPASKEESRRGPLGVTGRGEDQNPQRSYNVAPTNVHSETILEVKDY
jgi:hypothetical protein